MDDFKILLSSNKEEEKIEGVFLSSLEKHTSKDMGFCHLTRQKGPNSK